MNEAEARLARIKDDLDSGKTPDQATVRDLLSWFQAQRRGAWISAHIRQTLDRLGLITTPDFEAAYIDEELSFELKSAVEPDGDRPSSSKHDSLPDPTYRIGKLAAANTTPVSVKPDDTVERAVTLMLTNDFSQLPVMTSDRDVKGVISWTSLGSRLAIGNSCHYVRECMDTHREISSEDSLFTAIDTIVAHQYVLIRNTHNRISGIVTTSDISVQFKQLGEPFLLIGEIENYIRRMLQSKFSQDELAAAKDPADANREIGAISDLTFGEYRRLLENAAGWQKVGLKIDRVEFIHELDEIRRIRNDVMHFDPDGIPDSDLKVLRDFAAFLQRLATMNAI